MEPITNASARVFRPKFVGRMVGAGYLFMLASGFDLFYVLAKLYVRGDATSTYGLRQPNLDQSDAYREIRPEERILQGYRRIARGGRVEVDRRWNSRRAVPLTTAERSILGPPFAGPAGIFRHASRFGRPGPSCIHDAGDSGLASPIADDYLLGS
ncbi:MAG TPA: hypothetical protein VIK60_06555 [Vicinamibacterales bacterium]